MKFLTCIFVVVATLAIALNAVAQDAACVSFLGPCQSTTDCCPNLVCLTYVQQCVSSGQDGVTEIVNLMNYTFGETQTVADEYISTVPT